MSRILVVGAAGTVGSELTRLVVAQGETVIQATSREPRTPDQVHLDLVRRTGLENAFSGIDRAFFMAPPGHVNQDVLLAPLIDAARSHRLRKVVLMSAMGANADDAAPLRRAERRLEDAGMPFNIVRPNWFMQNFNTYWLPGILKDGQISLPVGSGKASFIDARDIAAVAARLLTTEAFADRDFDLTGPQAMDHAEVAAILSRTTGRTIGFTDISPEAMLQALAAAGMPQDYAQFLVTILGFLKAGYAERTTDAVRVITGEEPRSVAQYARDYRAHWA
jgi:uncharacterized protein YbjT (DUF2867 family)